MLIRRINFHLSWARFIPPRTATSFKCFQDLLGRTADSRHFSFFFINLFFRCKPSPPVEFCGVLSGDSATIYFAPFSPYRYYVVLGIHVYSYTDQMKRSLFYWKISIRIIEQTSSGISAFSSSKFPLLTFQTNFSRRIFIFFPMNFSEMSVSFGGLVKVVLFC